MPVSLPPLDKQILRLHELGIPELAGLSANDLDLPDVDNALLVVHPDRLKTSALAPLLRHKEKPGFVVLDMPDLDDFTPTVELPNKPVYLVTDIDRGDDMANWTPEDALPEITGAGRTPLTVGEGVQWLLHQPEALERTRCFMTISSRLRKADGKFDTRTPAIWISNGIGRDGRGHKDAPKVGWCWWGNRHTWLGFASGRTRS
ncbi:DUF5701 family protein [Actinokineospora cianjurensis]|uniref:Uncharacterized protein n=1 Tax=Actinokineospora cianjurensis TaxID=585224 RepID=A0A421B0R8_9PSEU|nr:DUF5701 family protein [Actinokineospora cianjurensis]RLK55611.1 hypothetical protein CLV68_5100 [Actinokineospora cianjurensis]